MVGDLTLLSRGGKRLLLVLLVLLALTPLARAHLLLYENVEVNLHDPARIRIEFTIHAPELPSAVAARIDPAAVDASWLRGLDDAAIAQLTREAEAFIRETFRINEVIGEIGLEFESPERIRSPAEDTKLPPGCLLATAWLENPGPPQTLEVGFAESAQKRLMVAIARPAAFPEVHDLAPGEAVAIDLPIPPEPEIAGTRPSILIIGMIGLVLIIAVIWRVRRKSG